MSVCSAAISQPVMWCGVVGQQLGAAAESGVHGFGPLSVAMVIVLGLVVAAAVWVARHPQRVRATAEWVGAMPPLRWVRERAQEHSAGRWRVVARRFARGEVAGAALTVGLALVLALAAVFTVLLDSVLDGEGIAAVDRPVSRWLGNHRDAWLTVTLRVITAVGSPVGVAVLAVLVFAGVAAQRRSWLPVLLGVAGAGGIGLVSQTVKVLVGRGRPPLPSAAIVEDGYSFPSGHTTGTTVVMVLSAWVLSRWIVCSWNAQVTLWTAGIVLIGLVGFSRVYLGVHYPSDVLAGWVLGTAWAGAVVVMGAWRERARQARTDGAVTRKGSADAGA